MLQSVCFSGHRPEMLLSPFNEQSSVIQNLKSLLKIEILLAIEQGATQFLSGMAQGVDLIASEIVLSLKKEYPSIQHIAVIPFKQQSNCWNHSWSLRHQQVKQCSDQVICLSEYYTRYCFSKRNRYMIEHSNQLIAVFCGDYQTGTGQTIQYAKKRGKSIRILEPIDSGFLSYQLEE